MKHGPSHHLASESEIILSLVDEREYGETAAFPPTNSRHILPSSLDVRSDALRREIASVRVDITTSPTIVAATTTATTTTALPYCGIGDGGGNQSMAPCSRDATASSRLREAAALSEWREASEQAEARHRIVDATPEKNSGIARGTTRTSLSASRQQAAERSPHGPQMSGNESADQPHRSPASSEAATSRSHPSAHFLHDENGSPTRDQARGETNPTNGSSEETPPTTLHPSPRPNDSAQMEAQSETTLAGGIDRLIERESPPPSTVSCIIEMFTYEDHHPTLIHTPHLIHNHDSQSGGQQSTRGMKKLLETSVVAQEILRDHEGHEGLKVERPVLEESANGKVASQTTGANVVFHPAMLHHPHPAQHHHQHPHLHHRHPAMLRSALKKTSDKKHKRRVTFSDTMTVFMDGCLEAQIVALHSPEFNIAEACYMYEPPPEYQDCLPFEPPPDYRDPDVTQEGNSETKQQKLETLSQPDVIREARGHCEDESAPTDIQKPTNTASVPSASSDEDLSGSSNNPARTCITIVPKEQEHQDTSNKDGTITMDEIARDLDFIDEDEDTEDEGGVLQDEINTEDEEEINDSIDQTISAEESEEERAARIEDIDSIDADIRELHEQLFGDDPNTKDFYATPIFVSSLDELEEGLFGDNNLESIMEDSITRGSGGLDADSDQFTPSASPLGSLSDSDSSVSSQDTMIMMTSEESERNEAHIKESLVRYETLRRQILGEGGGSGSNTDIFLCSDSESATDVLDNVTEELLNDLKESMNENSVADSEDNIDNIDNLSRTNSQIRRTLERNAMRRSLQTNNASDIKRRNQTDSLTRARSPMMLRDDSLEEKLRWLTTMEEDESGPSLRESEVTNSSGDVHEKYVDNRTPLSIIADSRTHSILAPVPIHPVRQSFPSHHQQQHVQSDRRVITRMVVSSSARPSSASLGEGMNKVPTASHGMMVQSLVIPSNLREWKISRTLDAKSSHHHPSENAGVTLQLRRNDDADPTYGYRAQIIHHHPVRKMDNGQEIEALDELETFVQRDSERIERIRKRYSLTEDGDDPTFGFARRPSVRGIKPKFGSTTEILKQMQSQLQPPAMSSPQGNSDTWPFREPVEGRFLHHQGPASSSPILDGWFPTTKLRFKEKRQLLRETRYGSVSDLVPHLRGVQGRENAVYLQVYSNPPSHLQTVVPQTVLAKPQQQPLDPRVQQHYSSQRQLVRDERGAPEGASSSPQVSSDSLYQALPVSNATNTEETKKEGVIYFAMNV